MAPLRSITLRNYRRFRGEIELPLSSQMDLIVMPPGMGKSSLAEAVAWCLIGRESGASPGDVINAEAKEQGEGALVALAFGGGKEAVLERSLSPGGLNMTMEAREGCKSGPFVPLREEMFPAACIDSNIISGPSLGRVMQGERTGSEKAVERLPSWKGGDAQLSSSMEATSLYLSMVPDASIDCLLFDERGRPNVQCDGPAPIGTEERYILALSAALAFARETCPDAPVILDEPFKWLRGNAMKRAAGAIAEFMDGRQLIVLLSDPSEIAALRATGRAAKELEIMG